MFSREVGCAPVSLMTLGAAATLTSPTSERSRGLKRIRYAASNSIKSCWNGPAKLASDVREGCDVTACEICTGCGDPRCRVPR